MNYKMFTWISIFILILILVILYWITQSAYAMTYNALSIHIDTPLSLLTEPVTDISLVHKHFFIAPQWHTDRVSHWIPICNTKHGHFMISLHGFRDLQICNCFKNSDGSFTDAKYKSRMYEFKKYALRKPATTEQIAVMLLKHTQSTKGIYNLFTNNCHHNALHVIKKFCVYAKDDPLIQHVAGIELLKRGIKEIRNDNIYDSVPSTVVTSKDKELTTAEKIFLT